MASVTQCNLAFSNKNEGFSWDLLSIFKTHQPTLVLVNENETAVILTADNYFLSLGKTPQAIKKKEKKTDTNTSIENGDTSAIVAWISPIHKNPVLSL